ncbi:general stress protein 13 [Peptoclostridium litorale DSM 5388]|uniref:RNA binding S1 domain-containing protein n=1 Tax=Peptoclostridium litorale DSM 5388 TaxID=1121324 RepID=A0A069RPU8_PEPLI|nr:S1 domain-containing post-transcriptional regulator GSP13 [Peptoclostridium litorale]KDR96197.1 RNA binding S1 domain-containing protein [Peptoclostridium litorale DSM 5388]SIO13398.1 general stress protein 13 [Peptoclostridium litorale DSM 5388]
MSEKFTVGQVVKGKVTGIKPFGAFVALDDNTQGLVHISQVTHGFLKDINEALSVGDEVEVKVLSIDENSKRISLSIKDAKPSPKPEFQPRPTRPARPSQPSQPNRASSNPGTLEDMLKQWSKDSNERQAAINKRSNK